MESKSPNDVNNVRPLLNIFVFSSTHFFIRKFLVFSVSSASLSKKIVRSSKNQKIRKKVSVLKFAVKFPMTKYELTGTLAYRKWVPVDFIRVGYHDVKFLMSKYGLTGTLAYGKWVPVTGTLATAFFL